MTKVISGYERVSGQMVNKDKSFFYVHEKSPLVISMRLIKLNGLNIGNFPFIYLGCPIFYGRKKSSFFKGLLNKISNRIGSWHNKFLSYGGKYTLINYMLASISIYLHSMMSPPKNVLDQIHILFASFFWSKAKEGKGKH